MIGIVNYYYINIINKLFIINYFLFYYYIETTNKIHFYDGDWGLGIGD